MSHVDHKIDEFVQVDTLNQMTSWLRLVQWTQSLKSEFLSFYRASGLLRWIKWFWRRWKWKFFALFKRIFHFSVNRRCRAVVKFVFVRSIISNAISNYICLSFFLSGMILSIFPAYSLNTTMSCDKILSRASK